MGSASRGGKRSRPRSAAPENKLDGIGPRAGEDTTDEEVFAAMADLGIDVDAVGEANRAAYGRYLRQQKRCHR